MPIQGLEKIEAAGTNEEVEVEERAADILAIWEARKDISLEELRAGLAEISAQGPSRDLRTPNPIHKHSLTLVGTCRGMRMLWKAQQNTWAYAT